MATRVIVEALKRAQVRWVSRQQVRDAARNYIGDTGLLDFVLKSLGNQIVGNYLVRRSLNPVTKVLEYCLEDISNVFHDDHQYEGNTFMANGSKMKYSRYKITRFQLMKDMFYLYKNILKDQNLISLNGGNILSAIPLAVQIVLDSKYLIKDYHGDFPAKMDLGLEGKLNLYCTVVLKNIQQKGHEYDDGNLVDLVNKPMLLPPYESVTIKNNATVDEMKLEVERNFKEIYWSLRGLVVDSLHNLITKGTDLATGVVSEIGQKLVFEGSIRNKDHNNTNANINYESLYESSCSSSNNNNSRKESVMDCPCGAKDDDGERRVSCDICETWQHTRCVGILNSEDVPHVFICNCCEQEIVLLPDSLP